MDRRQIPSRQWQYAKVIVVCFLMGLLTSCMSVKKKDGPPNFYVDETKIPNAVPKKEPLSKYGNMRVYHVFGKRYYTLKSSNRYTQVGTASWYGTSFHSRKTSSGEPYDMLAMTAAHRSLPLPTYVEVTNLYNHRKIIVKVNDRGPFKAGRIIDLSYVAAKKLGMLAHGTAKVRVKAIDPTGFNRTLRLIATKSKTLAKDLAIKPTYLQVGTFKHKSSAVKLRKRLVNLLKAPIKILRTKHKLYRVEVGPLHDITTISHITDHLKSLGLPTNKTVGA